MSSFRGLEKLGDTIRVQRYENRKYYAQGLQLKDSSSRCLAGYLTLSHLKELIQLGKNLEIIYHPGSVDKTYDVMKRLLLDIRNHELQQLSLDQLTNLVRES